MRYKCARILVMIGLTFSIGQIYAEPNNKNAAKIVPLVSLLLLESNTLGVDVEQKNDGFGLAGTKHTISFTIPEIDRFDIEVRPIKEDPNLKVFYGGFAQYSIPEDEKPSIKELNLRIIDRTSGNSELVTVEMEVIPTKVLAEGLIGNEGGQIFDDWQDYVVTAEPGTFENDAYIELRRGDKPNGEVIYDISSTTQVSKPLSLRLPKVDEKELSGVFFSAQGNNKSGLPAYRTLWGDANTADLIRLGLTKPLSNNLVSRTKVSSLKTTLEANITSGFESSKLISYCGGEAEYETVCGSSKPPVLLIHGFNGFAVFDQFGGGNQTWGNLVGMLREDGYPVFEFIWKTNSTFKRTADELGLAIDRINTVTGKKVNIIAHSFGGVLSRTYIQDFAETVEYGGGIQTLVTVGAPHSGIFPEDAQPLESKIRPNYDEVEVRTYLNGQDNFIFSSCTQFSCHQAGAPTDNTFFIVTKNFKPECEVSGNSFFPDPCRNQLRFEAINPESLGADTTSGMAIHRIQTTHPDHQNSVPTLALMSVTIDRSPKVECSNQNEWATLDDRDRFETGDALISFLGQRYNHASGEGAIQSYINPITDTPVTEKLLGLNSQVLVPGGLVDFDNTYRALIDGSCERIDFEGYRHTSAFALLTTSGTTPQVKVESRNPIGDTGKIHQTYQEVSDWLAPLQPDPIEMGALVVRTSIRDVETNAPITGAKVTFFAGSLRLKSTMSTSDGAVLIRLPRYINTEYSYSVIAGDYHPVDGPISFKIESESQIEIELDPIVMHENVLALSDIRVAPIHNYDKYVLSGVKYTISRNSIAWEGTTGHEGIIELEGLVRGNYKLVLQKEGYKSIEGEVVVQAGSVNSFSPKMIPNSLNLNVSPYSIGANYTKLDSKGHPLPPSSGQWSCVKDNVTGLYWEHKTDDGSVHDSMKSYSWGGYTAVNRSVTPRFGNFFEDWNELVNETNKEALCGFTNWRLPSRVEFRTIIDYSKNGPSVNTSYFPNIQSNAYWTNEFYIGDATLAWGIDLNYGLDAGIPRTNGRYIMLTRRN